jgi:hypothetical protein
MPARKLRPRLLHYVFLSMILLPLHQAQAQKDAEEVVEPQMSFERIGDESFLVDGMGDFGLEGMQFSGNPITEKVKKWPEDLVIAPVPGYSPQLGWNLTLAGGYFLNPRDPDSKSPPSVIGGLAMAAENGSTAYGGGTYLHLLDDKLRIQIGAAYADIRYDFYVNDVLGSDNDIVLDLEQNGPLYFVKATWRVWKRLYLGLGYLSGTVDTRVRFAPEFLPDLPLELNPNVKITLGAFIVPFEIDSRDNDQFPRNGWKIDGSAKFYREAAGSDFDAGVFKVFFNRYFPMRENDTLATRLVLKSSDGDAPFFLLSTFGGSKDLRGYPSGRYRDFKMYALQTEYRWHYSERWIFTGFAGFGEVAENFKDFGGEILPAAGVGARFVLSKKHQISLSSDIGVGKDGVEFYFGMGEAF